ncbi:Lipoamide acyltransferase [Ceratocystis platani]|uniref:Dihydrolipoamide acetyltransferase component of pyruvate dehydrogenase complex n=1 Tax=Ceratocystis fimbriata f. sp. platani TaxID=88771 RepID=A0A0F8CP52_CERFI|nr:Lipoamide acyltransferase [Ceratocystis platani]
MFMQRSTRVLRALPVTRQLALHQARGFRISPALQVVKPVVLADIGEGIVECEIIQWFVQPGARVEEFSPLCEVQSDKASVEITSRFAGIVKKLKYEAGEMARVGQPFVEIDIDGSAEELETAKQNEQQKEEEEEARSTEAAQEAPADISAAEKKRLYNGAIATPAVRHLSRQHDIDITQIRGTGKDGRVLKEDVHSYLKTRDTPAPQSQALDTPAPNGQQIESAVPLTGTQAQMFKTMTRSLAIPHFLYADEVDFTRLDSMRSRLNTVLTTLDSVGISKVSFLPFIIKAVSIALQRYPILNTRVEAGSGSKPQLIYRSQHNIGVAMDTPQGLVVPVIQDVGSLSVVSIASEVARLQALGLQGKLSPRDLQGGTITVSNIGSIGGTYVSPVIVDKEVAILGVGRMRKVPAFGGEDGKSIVEKCVCNFSWSADHRVIDGATMARAGDLVKKLVEEPELLMVQMR